MDEGYVVIVYPGDGRESPQFEVVTDEEAHGLGKGGYFASFHRVGGNMHVMPHVRRAPDRDLTREFLAGWRAKAAEVAEAAPRQGHMAEVAAVLPPTLTPRPPCGLCGHVIQRHIIRDGIPFCAACPQPEGSEAHKHVYRPGTWD